MEKKKRSFFLYSWQLLIASLLFDGFILLSAQTIRIALDSTPAINTGFFTMMLLGSFFAAATPLVLYRPSSKFKQYSSKQIIGALLTFFITAQILLGMFSETQGSALSSSALLLGMIVLGSKVFNILRFGKGDVLPQSRKISTITMGLFFCRVYFACVTFGVLLNLLQNAFLLGALIIAASLLYLYANLIKQTESVT